MTKNTITRAQDEIGKALEEAYHADGKTYAKKLRQTRKHLPRRLVKDAEYLIEAEQKLKHPKTRKFVNQQRVQSTKRKMLRQTQGVDLDRDRSKARFGWWSSLVLQLMLAMVLIVAGARYVGAL